MNKLTATVVLLGLTLEGVSNATSIGTQPKNKLTQLKAATTTNGEQEMPKPYNLVQL
jgi:hypothetical protein